MPRPNKSSRYKRSQHLGVRLLTAQRRKLVRCARTAGLTISAYVSHLIDGDGGSITLAPPPAEIVPSALLAQWQRAGNNLNQIARAMNRGRDTGIEWIVDAVRELMALMIEDQLTRRHALQFGVSHIALRLP